MSPPRPFQNIDRREKTMYISNILRRDKSGALFFRFSILFVLHYSIGRDPSLESFI